MDHIQSIIPACMTILIFTFLIPIKNIFSFQIYYRLGRIFVLVIIVFFVKTYIRKFAEVFYSLVYNLKDASHRRHWEHGCAVHDET